MFNDKKLQQAVLNVMIGEAKKPLHPNQQKLDVHEPEKDELTAKDFAMLRAGKKAKMKEEVSIEDLEMVIEYALSEGWDDMLKAAEERRKAQGTGKFDKKVISTGTVYTRKPPAPKSEKDDDDMKKAGKKPMKEETDDQHFARQSQKMQDAINMHLRKGKGYKEAVAAAQKHVKEETEYTFGDYLQAAKAKYSEEEAIQVANDAFNKKDTSIFSSNTEA